MRIENDKIEFDMSEFAPLLLENKQEGFRRIGEMFLNISTTKEFAAFIDAEKSDSVRIFITLPTQRVIL